MIGPASRPALLGPSTIVVGATSIALALVLGALYFYVHSRWATVAMVAAVLVCAAVFLRVLGLVVGAVVLLIVTSFIDQWVFSAGRFNIRPEQMAMIVALAVFAYIRLREHRGLSLRPNFPEAALLAWFALGLVSSVVAAVNRVESLKILALLGVCALAYFLPRRILEDAAKLELVVGWLLLAFAFESAYAVATYFLHLFGPTITLTVNPGTGHLDAIGTLWEPNVLGAVCGAGAVAWVVLGPRYFIQPWIGVTLCLTACAASFARAAWLATLIVLILVVATSVRKRIDLRALGAGGLAATVLIVGVIASDRVGRYSPGSSGVGSSIGNGTDVVGRLYQFKDVAADLHGKLRLILGGGTDSYGQRHVIGGVPQHIANLELSILNDTGILGLIVFAAFAVAIVVAAWRLQMDITVLGLAAMTLVLALTNTSTETLELMITWLLIGLLAAAMQVAGRVSVPESPRTAPSTVS